MSVCENAFERLLLKQEELDARLRSRLTRALETLQVHYQPIVTPTGHLYGVEALARCDATLFQNTEALFEAAVEQDRVFELGRAIRQMVFDDLEHLDPATHIFVNVHPAELADPTLRLGREPFSALGGRVVLEITEQERLPAGTELALQQLRRQGYRIAVDDMGRGEDSLVRLSRVAPDIAKLDGDLVGGVARSPWKMRFVQAIMEICASRGIPVVAEGVERVEDRQALFRAGVTLLQGHLFAEASPWPIDPGPYRDADTTVSTPRPSTLPAFRRGALAADRGRAPRRMIAECC